MPAARRSVKDGVEQARLCHKADGTAYWVPSYFVTRGHSVAQAARELGLRVAGRREAVDAEARGLVVAEIHDGGMSSLCVASHAGEG